MADNAAFMPENGALSIKSVSFADSGEYHCIVNSKKEDGFVRFFVQGMPTLKEEPFVWPLICINRNQMCAKSHFHIYALELHSLNEISLIPDSKD